MTQNSEDITVGMGKYEVCSSGPVLVAVGIGSCVAVVLYDKYNKVYGMAHVMLPTFTDNAKSSNPNKYANVAIPNMISDMQAKGARKVYLKSKIAGGAHMFPTLGSGAGTINNQNVEAVKQSLSKYGVTLEAEDTGGNLGRTVQYFTEKEEMHIVLRSRGEDKVL